MQTGAQKLSVIAPVICGTSRESAQPLIDFIDALARQPNTRTAALEARRLSPYFKTLHRNLSPMLRGKRKTAVTPKALAHSFNAVARITHNTLLSHVAILPQNALYLLENKPPHLNFNYNIGQGDTLGFGFIQVMSDKGAAVDKIKTETGSSTTFGALFLSGFVIQVLESKPGGLQVLKTLQKIATLVNHDMMHHWTTPIVNERNIAKHFNDESFYINNAQHQWYGDVVYDNERWLQAYEQWALAAHHTALLSQPHDDLTRRTCNLLKRYYTQLEKIKPFPGGETTAEYLSSVAGHMLMRVFPLNHAVMSRWLTHDMSCNNSSVDEILNEALYSVSNVQRDDWYAQTPQRKLEILHTHLNRHHVPELYCNIGYKLFPDSYDDLTPQQARLIQLAAVSRQELMTAIPARIAAPAFQKQAETLADMLVAADKVVKKAAKALKKP